MRRKLQHVKPATSTLNCHLSGVQPFGVYATKARRGWFNSSQRAWLRAIRSAAASNIALLFLIATAQAQPNSPRIGYVYPAGGQVGTTFEVKVGGQFLEGVTNTFVTGGGVEVIVTDFHRPMPQGQFTNLRDKLLALREKRQAARRGDSGTNSFSAADEKEMTELREKVFKNPPNRNATPAIADVATLRVTVATNAAPGDREIRLATGIGLSNPLKFCVGTLSEFTARPARAPNPDEDRMRRQFGLPPLDPPTTNIARVTLPIVINGQIAPGEVDRYRFSARRGQQLVVVVSARDLIPYLADAVPGWFQATVALYDAKGKELAYDDDFRSQPDPVLHFAIPRDGDYLVEIKDAIYRGREDFVYRIALGELPFVTSVFPLGARGGETVAVELSGWHLPVKKLMPDTKSPGITMLSVSRDKQLSNLIPFAVDNLPEATEREPNNTSGSAQKLTAPVIVNGRIDPPGDTDVFQIEGRAGEEIVAEVTARRLNSPLDSVVKFYDAADQQLALNDDCDDKGCGLNTHHADSYLRIKLPADGKFFIHLADVQRQGGPEYSYRLRISAPRPDFELRAAPSSLSLRSGGSVPLRIVALRKDGFTNEIVLALQNAPPGFKLSGSRIPANTNEVKLTLTAPVESEIQTFPLALEGHAQVAGVGVSRTVVPADDLMQAFFYRHLVPAQELRVAVTGRGPPRAAVRILSAVPVKIPVGGTARVKLEIPAARFAAKLQLEIADPPEGISIKSFATGLDATELILQCSAETRLGTKGNLIINAFNARTDPEKDKRQARRAPLATLPAIPFEVVGAR